MQDEKCAFYIAATEKLSESEKHEIEMDIKNAEIYLRNSENEKHRKITTTQPEYFDGIRSIPINQIEVPPCFKKNRTAEKKIDSMIEYYKERGHFDKPVTVVFRNDKYVLKDKFIHPRTISFTLLIVTASGLATAFPLFRYSLSCFFSFFFLTTKNWVKTALVWSNEVKLYQPV